jgi:type II secretory pathway pseudopilin PulG
MRSSAESHNKGTTLVEGMVAITLLAFGVCFILISFSYSQRMKHEADRLIQATRLSSQLLEDFRSIPLDLIVPSVDALPQTNLRLSETIVPQTEDGRTLAEYYERLDKYNLDVSISIELYDNRIDIVRNAPETIRISVAVADEDLFDAAHALMEPEVNDVVIQLSTLMTRGGLNP